MEKELRLINVNKTYKLEGKETFQALYDVSVEFDKGELVSIVGESGSGKSTLMNLIGGLDSDFTGDIIAGGVNLRELSDKQLDKYRKNKVGFVFQSFNLISHLSILDNVTLSLTLSNVGEKEKVERATKILERVGLATQLKKKPTQLSGGQKQRVAIARALINDPDIIIADEPTGALDSGTSMQILEILKEIADSGKLVIMVTHSEKVASISSRVVEISDGRIVGDRKNEKYKKSKAKTKDKTENEENVDTNETKEVLSKSEKKHAKRNFANFKDKQNLSLWQAIRLSFHNMWASKTKNFLMAFGVAIGIGSLILMMTFSSGITDFIDDTMSSYSDPTVVTITKKGSSSDATSMFSYNPFSSEDNEVEELVDDINKHLSESGVEYQIVTDKKAAENNDPDSRNLYYGLQMMTMTTGAVAVYSENPDLLTTNFHDAKDYLNTEKLESLSEQGLKFDSVIYLYTIPLYYSDTNVLEGKMATKDGGIMFSSSIKNTIGNNVQNDDGTNKKISIAFNFSDPNSDANPEKPQKKQFAFLDQEITGIMDASIMSNFLVMYMDYDYFQQIFNEQTKTSLDDEGSYLDPNVLYVRTPSKKITDIINNYLRTRPEYTGAIEEQFATMFRRMSSVIGTSLIVISCISLFVSAMMILVVLYMSVSERTKEIGVLKSIGARRKDIRRIFTSESFLIGLLSGVVGILFNLILTLIVHMLLLHFVGLAPISYRWWYFFIGIGVSIFISMLSGLYPASKAAKLDPVESLRRE